MATPFCIPESPAPGMGLEVSTNGSIQFAGAVEVDFNAESYSGLPYDCDRQAGFGQYLAYRQTLFAMTSAERVALVDELFDGMEVFETNTLLTYVYVGAAWVQRLDLDDWATFTAQFKQNAAITIGSTTFRFTRQGRFVTVLFEFQATAATATPNVAVKLTPTGLPAKQLGATAEGIGSAYYARGGGVGQYHCDVSFDSEDIWFIANGFTNNRVGSDPAFGVAINEVCYGWFVYEAAT